MATHSTTSSPVNGLAWKERSRVVLTPVAAPAVLGWAIFAIAALLVGTRFADLWGGDQTLMYLAPFLLFLGIGQLTAGMWGFRAREPMATLVHGVWGCLWLGLGLAYTFVAFGFFEASALRMPMGFVLLAVGALTLSVTIAAAYENLLMMIVAALATLGGVVSGVGLMRGTDSIIATGGWIMIVGAALAWYLATAILVAEATGRQRLPMGDFRMATDLPGEPRTQAVAYNTGMPLLDIVEPEGRRARQHI